MGCCYNFVWYLLRFVLYVFIYERSVSGYENVPKKGAIIFAGNHPNGLVDPSVLVASNYRTLHFMAKAPLFNALCGLTGVLLRSLGAIPVYRKKPGEKGGSNDDAFRAVEEVLSREKCFAIFPEGVSHTDSEMKELKSGISRIALDFVAKHPETPLYVVPTGITYTEGHRFRTSCWVKYGEPILVPAELIADFKSEDEESSRKAVKSLTQIIAAGIRRYTINAEDWATVKLILLAVQLFRPSISRSHIHGEEEAEGTSSCCGCWCCGVQSEKYSMHIGRHLHFGSLFAARYAALKDVNVMKVFRERIEEYNQLLSQLRMTDDDIRYHRSVSTVELVATSCFYMIVLLIFVPLSLPGVIYSLPIALPARYLGKTAAKKGGRDVLATFKIMIAFVLTPLVYGTYIGVASYYTAKYSESQKATAGWFALYLIGIPLVGIMGLRFMEEGNRVAGYWTKLCAMVGANSRLAAVQKKREELHKELRALVVMFHEKSDKETVTKMYGSTFPDEMSVSEAHDILHQMCNNNGGGGQGSGDINSPLLKNSGTVSSDKYSISIPSELLREEGEEVVQSEVIEEEKTAEKYDVFNQSTNRSMLQTDFSPKEGTPREARETE